MKKSFFWLLFLLILSFSSLFLFGEKGSFESLPDLSLKCFEKLMENPAARDVFDLEEKEAIEVFGDESKVIFL